MESLIENEMASFSSHNFVAENNLLDVDDTQCYLFCTAIKTLQNDGYQLTYKPSRPSQFFNWTALCLFGNLPLFITFR